MIPSITITKNINLLQEAYELGIEHGIKRTLIKQKTIKQKLKKDLCQGMCEEKHCKNCQIINKHFNGTT